MKVIGRSSGTYINPNSTTIALLTFSFIGIKYIKNDVNKLLYLIIVGIGVFLSLSRAGILIFIIIFIFHLIQSKSILKNGAIIFGVSIIFPFLIGSVSNSFEQLGSDASRFNLILNLSENTNNISENIEEDGRSVVAKEGYNMTFANPVFGSGTATYRNIPFENQVLETHNIFLAFSVDFGILGFFIYPFFLFFLFLRNGLNFNGIMQFVIFFIWGFASHNVLHEYFLLLVFSYYSIINHNEN
jgi:O-antigen ligase